MTVGKTNQSVRKKDFLAEAEDFYDKNMPDDLVMMSWKEPSDSPNMALRFSRTLMSQSQIVSLLRGVADILVTRTGLVNTFSDLDSLKNMTEEEIKDAGIYCANMVGMFGLFVSNSLYTAVEEARGDEDAVDRTYHTGLLDQMALAMMRHCVKLAEDPVDENKLLAEFKDFLEKDIAEENAKTAKRVEANEKIVNSWKEFINDKRK
ncbi:MAG: hypothetical protein UE295_07365 [Acutalibacteraceae bacterium]|nr:hypothetical protein [Acutalibacteraceae bacterium]